MADENAQTCDPGGANRQAPWKVVIKVLQGDITRAKARVAICPAYQGLPLAGATRAFDLALDNWLTRGIDLGIIGLTLGRLFPVSLKLFGSRRTLDYEALLLVGMGEPGRLAPDDLRYLWSNVTITARGLGYDGFATSLVGTRRHELPIDEAARSLLQGVIDGHERLKAIADVITVGGDEFRAAIQEPLNISIVINEGGRKAEDAKEAFKKARDDYQNNAARGVASNRRLDLEIGDEVEVIGSGDLPPLSQVIEEGGERVTLLRATVRESGGKKVRGLETRLMEFSATCDTAVIATRDQEISRFLLEKIPERLITPQSTTAMERFGRLFAITLIPTDFRPHIESSFNLSIEVDQTTAELPWEMMALEKYSKTTFLSLEHRMSRQFRTSLGPAPGSPPPLNHNLKILIIADPAGSQGLLALPQAREEGFAVVEAVRSAQMRWRNAYEFEATIRIGSYRENTKDPRLAAYEEELKQARQAGDMKFWIRSVDWCDPLEINERIVNEEYDVIHYAGHGFFDDERKLAGWALDEEFFLTAQDLFRVRQVPRLVFANACYSAAVPTDAETRDAEDHSQGRRRLVSAAEAFFARGIPNFIGTGWPVRDAAARACAQAFYRQVFGIPRPQSETTSGPTKPSTIGAGLREGRLAARSTDENSSTWGAYQHYGRASDLLLAPTDGFDCDGEDREVYPSAANPTPPTESPPAPIPAGLAPSETTPPGDEKMPENQPSSPAGATPELLYFNGVNAETGEYAVKPMTVEDLVEIVRARPGVAHIKETHGDEPRSFGLPRSVNYEKLDQAGWGVVFHERTPQEIRAALAPLLDARRQQAKDRYKELTYKEGEQARDWYQRYSLTAGALDPLVMPYYLLIVGPPDLVPFEFQYLLGVDYAVGRLAFDAVADYGRYVKSLLDYEGAGDVPNAKEIVYWGTQHTGDGATRLSSTLLIGPLANGDPNAAGALKKPVHSENGFGCEKLLADDATRDALLAALTKQKPPALLFTASHGMSVNSGGADQGKIQGALLCQDWSGFGRIKPSDYLTAADVPDDANVKGMIAFIFACFGGGTPDVDQFLLDPNQAGHLAPLAPQPFMAALPQRLLAHPKGGALAVVAHVDRAWGYSIQAPKMSGAQINTFRNSLESAMCGDPIGHAIHDQFGGHFAVLSTALLSALSPTAVPGSQLSDRDIVTYWLQRNDAQNYVTLGDPAARIRADKLA